MEKDWIDWAALILVILGGLNWGIYAFTYYDLVEIIFNRGVLARMIYALIGISALYTIYFITKE